MMLLALLLAVEAPLMTAVEAERAFATVAQREGQWTAFRRFATPDAMMFVPGPTNAQAWLKDRKDPPKAIDWWPTESFVSCDEKLAVNHGGWRRPNGTVGFFSTVWQRQRDGGWKWIVDGGDTLAAALPRPATPKVVRASCTKKPPRTGNAGRRSASGGVAADGTLIWEWSHNSAGDLRVFGAYLWNGDRFVDVVDDAISVK